MLSYETRHGGMAPPTPPNAGDHLPISTQQRAKNTLASVTTDGRQPTTAHRHIWLVTGPAGCGKSTVAEYVANAMNLPFLEGDSYHPQENIDKMSNDIPLTDSDRWGWLTRLREEAVQRLEEGSQGVVVTCSALKRIYRDVIRVAPYFAPDIKVHFVYLSASEEVLLERVAKRKNHYMKPSMVHSQFEALEPPTRDEKDVISVDVSMPIAEVEKEALAKIELSIQQELFKDS